MLFVALVPTTSLDAELDDQNPDASRQRGLRFALEFTTPPRSYLQCLLLLLSFWFEVSESISGHSNRIVLVHPEAPENCVFLRRIIFQSVFNRS